MSKQNGQDPGKRVDDTEGTVDEKFKTRIIDARNRVDRAEEKIFVEAATDPNVEINPQEQILTWATIVKQFLRTIEPILRDEDVEQSQEYYREKEIGNEVLYPPNMEGYPFRKVLQFGMTDVERRRALELPRGVDIPEPEKIEFDGLKSIIESPNVLENQWVVTIDTTGPPPDHERIYPTQQTVISKEIFENAIRHADQFLQNINIGVDVSEGDTPIIRGFDQSGESNDAELDNADYQGDPDI